MNMYTKIVCFFQFFLIAAYIYADNDDNYLKQLELEVENEIVETPSGVEKNLPDKAAAEHISTKTELILDKTRLITNRNDFEKALNDTYKESFQLYEQLTEVQKQAIYKEFSQGELLTAASLKIISVYLSSH